jgi:HlyD family secretion protein
MKRFRFLFLAIVIALAFAGYSWWKQQHRLFEVSVGKVESGMVERTITNTRAGTLNACRRAKLSPSLGGQIASLPVKEGDLVTLGQTLFEIWNKDLTAQVELANAEVTASRALKKQACVQAELAQREARRLTLLKERGLASDESAEKAVSASLSSQAACDAAEASVDVSLARLNVARALLEKTRLLAPFDGTIAEVNGELGEFVTPSPIGIATPPAVDIIDNSCVYVAAPIDEVDAPEIKAGMPARISLDAFPGKLFEGQVRRVAPYVLDREKQARTVDIEVDFVGTSELAGFLPGYTADAEVILDAHGSSLRIPSSAILEGNRVYRLDEDDHSLELVDIETGLSNWDHTEVLSGLVEGERIVLSIDVEGLEDGITVKPIEP